MCHKKSTSLVSVMQKRCNQYLQRVERGTTSFNHSALKCTKSRLLKPRSNEERRERNTAMRRVGKSLERTAIVSILYIIKDAGDTAADNCIILIFLSATRKKFPNVWWNATAVLQRIKEPTTSKMTGFGVTRLRDVFNLTQ